MKVDTTDGLSEAFSAMRSVLAVLSFAGGVLLVCLWNLVGDMLLSIGPWDPENFEGSNAWTVGGFGGSDGFVVQEVVGCAFGSQLNSKGLRTTSGLAPTKKEGKA